MIIECSSRIREWSVKMLISFYLHFLTTNLMLMKHPWVIKKRPVIKAHSVKGGSNSKGRWRRQSYVTCPLQKTSNQGWQGPFMVVKEAPREITFNGGPPKISSSIKSLDFLQVKRRKKRLFRPWTRQWKRFQRTLNAALAIVITTIKSWRIRRFIVLMKCPSRWLLKVDTFCQEEARGVFIFQVLRGEFFENFIQGKVWIAIGLIYGSDWYRFVFIWNWFFKGQVLSKNQFMLFGFRPPLSKISLWLFTTRVSGFSHFPTCISYVL